MFRLNYKLFAQTHFFVALPRLLFRLFNIKNAFVGKTTFSNKRKIRRQSYVDNKLLLREKIINRKEHL